VSTPIGRALEAVAERLQKKWTIEAHHIEAIREAATLLNGDHMPGHKTVIKSHKLDKSGKLTAKKPRSVSAQVAVAKSKKRTVVSPAKARAAR
jgi:hypothetical protein